MESSSESPLFDATDILLLATIGLGTMAWFTRHQLKSLLTGKKNEASAVTKTTTTAKRETNFVKVMEQQGRRVIVFYGSQTGTAEGYAARIAKECQQRFGVSCMTADLELYDLSYLDQVPKENLVIFVLATYGEGDPTDNAVEFWDLVTEEEPSFSEESRLDNLNYVIFGLGNKTYEQYNEVGRRINKRLQQLGAHLIGEAGEGDDDGSLEEDYLTWKDNMWPAFCECLGVDENSARSGPREPVYEVQELLDYTKDDVYFGELAEKPKSGAKIAYDAKRPYLAQMTTRELFHGADRHCMHVEVDISNSNLKYTTGDHLAIWPTNNENEVNRLASVLGLTDKLDAVVSVQAIDPTAPKKYPFPVPTTYRAIFRYYLEICAPISRQVLGSFIEFAPSEEAKAALTLLASDKDAYRTHVSEACRNLGEVLQYVTGQDTRPGLFSSVPFDLIVETIARMQPRFYSISSSAKESPKKISATIVTLSYQPESTPERTVFGVNTNFLYYAQMQHEQINDPTYPVYDLAGPRQSYLGADGKLDKLPVHIRSSTFKLPRNPSVPVIMIGPGTGVAPFRGFVRERAFDKQNGKPVGTTILFYGSRNASQDYLYADEWPALFETLGGDSKIITAFSRDQAQKIYVQHRLLENGAMIWDLVQKGGYVYVCGDAKNMARDVNQTFVHFAVQLGGMDDQKAQDYVKSLRTTGRYQEDVWS